MDRSRKSTLAGSAVIVATVAVAVFFGPYIRTPTGGRQLDQNKSGSVLVAERISDLCGIRQETISPSFRTWIPKPVMAKVSKVTVTTGDISESIQFSEENCRSTSTLKKIGKAFTCVRECIDRACLVAVKPQGADHFGASEIHFVDDAGRSLHSETFSISRRDVAIPEVSVAVGRDAIAVRTKGGNDHLSSVVHFPPSENAPAVLAFEDGAASLKIPANAHSYAIFTQRAFGDVESLDLHLGSLDSESPDSRCSD